MVNNLGFSGGGENIKIELNRIFTVEKGSKKTRWKVIEHPYFDSLCLVRDYSGLYGAMRSGVSKDDYVHICGQTTLETAYEDAFVMS